MSGFTTLYLTYILIYVLVPSSFIHSLPGFSIVVSFTRNLRSQSLTLTALSWPIRIINFCPADSSSSAASAKV